jgi:hypothetical protein
VSGTSTLQWTGWVRLFVSFFGTKVVKKCFPDNFLPHSNKEQKTLENLI